MKKILFFIFIAIFLFISWKVYRKCPQSVWDGRHKINIVVNPQPLILVSFEPGGEKPLNILTFPEETFIEVAHGYGFYKIGAIYTLGQLEKKQGGKLLAESLQNYLGIPIDAYASVYSSKNLISEIIWDLLKNKGETNLSKWDLIRLWWQAKKVRQNKIVWRNLGEEDIGEKETLTDGSTVLKINLEKTDLIMALLFKDSFIRQEDLAIGILNATSHQGLANQASRLITNMGGRVIEIGDEKIQVSGCQIKAEKAKVKSYTFQKLTKVFNCRWSGGDLENQRADILLTLGENLW